MTIKDQPYRASLFNLAHKHLNTAITLIDQAQECDSQKAYDTLKVALVKLSAARRLLYAQRNVLQDHLNSEKLRNPQG